LTNISIAYIFVLYKSKYKTKTMANKKYSPEHEAEFRKRLEAVKPFIKSDFREKVFLKNKKIKISTIENVKRGFIPDFDVLEIFETLYLPVNEKI
jgi:hypothetical protein